MTDQPLLRVRDLSVSVGGSTLIRDVGFTLGRERLGLVGESGSGKSTTGRAIMGLLPRQLRVRAAELAFDGIDLTALDEPGWVRLRGRRIGMILQDPIQALNPVMTVGSQIAETYRAHFGGSARTARDAALAMLERVQIRDPARVATLYAHQISGGMGQRVMIACALIAEPDLLIADEPTSALDATVQNQILSLLDELVRERGLALILISHNLPLVASFCDRVLVMYGGRIVETCAAKELAAAQHPYTQGLIAAIPSLHHPRAELPQLQRDPAWLL
jgi:peptide/nickel transport system ATP-binding protein